MSKVDEVVDAQQGGAIAEDFQRLAESDVTVLIGGETGSGKGLLARSIHAHSRRASARFVTADCSAIASSLFEAQLFGSVKGAYTGSTTDRLGLVRAADGGTLFLDEIGDLPLDLQAKLLTLIEDRSVLPVGSERRIDVDVRLIAATHRNLHLMVEDGEFREDLYYRLAVVEVTVPPLRERKQEIPEIVAQLIARKAPLLKVPARSPSEEFIAELMSYDWPGNIRELGNCIERALVFSRGERLDAQTLPSRVRGCEDCEDGEDRKLELGDVLAETGGNKAEAARRLGISRRHLYRLLDAQSR